MSERSSAILHTKKEAHAITGAGAVGQRELGFHRLPAGRLEHLSLQNYRVPFRKFADGHRQRSPAGQSPFAFAWALSRRTKSKVTVANWKRRNLVAVEIDYMLEARWLQHVRLQKFKEWLLRHLFNDQCRQKIVGIAVFPSGSGSKVQ